MTWWVWAVACLLGGQEGEELDDAPPSADATTTDGDADVDSDTDADTDSPHTGGSGAR